MEQTRLWLTHIDQWLICSDFPSIVNQTHGIPCVSVRETGLQHKCDRVAAGDIFVTPVTAEDIFVTPIWQHLTRCAAAYVYRIIKCCWQDAYNYGYNLALSVIGSCLINHHISHHNNVMLCNTAYTECQESVHLGHCWNRNNYKSSYNTRV